MPTFKSDRGVWTPAPEKAVNIKTGDIYEGPDREATQMLEEAGGFIGQDSAKDPENIMRARQLGMKTEDFLKLNDPPSKEQIKQQMVKEAFVADHKPTAKKRGVKPRGGGSDTSGQGLDISGGFGKQPNIQG